MTVHALLVDPPIEGLALDGVDVLAPDEAATLAEAMLKDTLRNVAGTGGDLLVNFPSATAIPDAEQGDDPPETILREIASDALDDPSEVRFEVQVGDSYAERAGNTATHLLEEEDADSVAILDGRTPTLRRTALDSAAMKLRRNEVVIAPAAAGRVAYVGLSEPIDFTAGFQPPMVESLTAAATGAGLTVDFLPLHPSVASDVELATLIATVRARKAAGRLIPEFTTAAIKDLGLEVTNVGGRRTVSVD